MSSINPPAVDQRVWRYDQTRNGLRVGRVPDNSINVSDLGYPNPVGVPVSPPFIYNFNNPAVADVDYFITTTATGNTAFTLTSGILNSGLMPSLTEASPKGTTAIRHARNISATLSGAATAELVITGFDIQGRAQTETLSWSAATGAKYGVKAFSKITALTGTSDTNRNITVGFANVFGLPYPLYHSAMVFAPQYDADGADYPNTSMDSDYTVTAGDPTNTAADKYGTILLGADNTVGGTKAPDGTATYVFCYIVSDIMGVPGTGMFGGTFTYDQT